MGKSGCLAAATEGASRSNQATRTATTTGRDTLPPEIDAEPCLRYSHKFRDNCSSSSNA